MPFLAALPLRQIGLWVAAVALVAGLILWLRHDAVQGERAKASERRIEHILKARERRNETRDLADDDLERELLDRVRHGPR